MLDGNRRGRLYNRRRGNNAGKFVSSGINRMGRKLMGRNFNRSVRPNMVGGIKTYDFRKGGMAKTGRITTGRGQKANLLFRGGNLRMPGGTTFSPGGTRKRNLFSLRNINTVLQGGSIDVDQGTGLSGIRG